MTPEQNLKTALVGEIEHNLCDECIPLGRCRLRYLSPERLDAEQEKGACPTRDYRPEAPTEDDNER